MTDSGSLFGAGLPFTLSSAGPVPPPAPGPMPLLVAYGDSYTATRGGEGPRGWLALTAGAVGMEPVNNAVSGSGYVTVGGGTTWPYMATIAPVPDAAVVIVMGSQNDRHRSPVAVALAAEVTYAAIAVSCPTARRLIVGPHYPWSGAPTAEILAVRDAIRAVADAHRLPFLDPLAEDWLHSRPGLIGPDGAHPNIDGQAVIAERVIPHVAALLS